MLYLRTIQLISLQFGAAEARASAVSRILSISVLYNSYVKLKWRFVILLKNVIKQSTN
jgi:hypothetical protein